jgi:hypothetical protein
MISKGAPRCPSDTVIPEVVVQLGLVITESLAERLPDPLADPLEDPLAETLAEGVS